jgi:hypothetical protein
MKKKKFPKFIVVHVPKTGGGTFKHILKNYYGENFRSASFPKASINYAEFPVIQGHFRFNKYNHAPKVTWVRDPVERVISHFYYWNMFLSRRRILRAEHGLGIGLIWLPSLDEQKIKTHQSKRRYDFTLLEFAELFPNLMRFYLGEDLSIYKFIGITEQYSQSMGRFNSTFGLSLPTSKEHIKPYLRNIGKGKQPVKPADRKKIAQFNKEDVELYREALDIVGKG